VVRSRIANRVSAIGALILLAALSASSSFAQNSEEPIQHCAAIPTFVRRLTCYDLLAQLRVTEHSETTSRGGGTIETTDRGEGMIVYLHPELMSKLDAWIKAQPGPPPSRAEAIRQLLYETRRGVDLRPLVGLGPAAYSQNLPSYMEPIIGRTASSPADTLTKKRLALNTGMFELYGDAGQIFQANLLSKEPVIVALFSGAGVRFMLHRPDQALLEALSVPTDYQVLKSNGEPTMLLTQVDNPADQSRRSPMLAYRSRMKSALDRLDVTPMPPERRDNNRLLLENNLAFVDECLAKGTISIAALEAFVKNMKRDAAWSAQTQVAQWMTVLADWKALRGSDWAKTEAASNTIYVARQNNIVYSGCSFTGM